MRSMTGHGWGECAKDGFNVTVEVSSVNRKQTEITVTLPRELEVLEAPIRDEINRQVSRGRLTVRVSLQTVPGQEARRVHLSWALARAYARQFNRLARELKLASGVSLDTLLRAPGVLESEAHLVEPSRFWPAIHKALRQALQRLIQTRQREGAHLRKELCHRMRLIQRAAAQVAKYAPAAARRYRQALLRRIRLAGLRPADVDPDRLQQEVVLFAERSDITEELTRLQSHFQQFQDCLKATGPVGRMLDFLAQEMNREIHTIGAKANDRRIARQVVVLKTELEKFREQVQNVE